MKKVSKRKSNKEELLEYFWKRQSDDPTIQSRIKSSKDAKLDTEERNAGRAKEASRRMPRPLDLIGKLVCIH